MTDGILHRTGTLIGCLLGTLIIAFGLMWILIEILYLLGVVV